LDSIKKSLDNKKETTYRKCQREEEYGETQKCDGICDKYYESKSCQRNSLQHKPHLPLREGEAKVSSRR
jgi:hypothetical protein